MLLTLTAHHLYARQLWLLCVVYTSKWNRIDARLDSKKLTSDGYLAICFSILHIKDCCSFNAKLFDSLYLKA